MGTWITDAQFAGPISDEDIHKTQDIRKFLQRDNEMHFILVASKGMGKTMLMRLKREQIQGNAHGVTIVPHNSETDYVSLPSSPSKSMVASLRDQLYWTALWQTSIMVSVLLSTHPSQDVVARQRAAREIESFGLPQEIAEDLDDALMRGVRFLRKPSEILDALLRQSKPGFERFRALGLAKLGYIFRDLITNACAVFIDSLDQELETKFPQDLEIWRTGQLGLMRAAWDLNRLNNHIKVFVTIRQEAYASFDDSIKNNLSGSAIIIKYSESDLRKIFELVIRKNDGLYSIAEFFGFTKIYNHFINEEEEIFAYLMRHTIAVPRWFVMLGYEVSKIRDGRDIIADDAHLKRHQRAIAETINAQSAALAKDYIRAEMRLFFQTSDPISELSLLLSNVPSTVMTHANLSRIEERYLESSAAPIWHPFWLLVNVGLLGYTEKNVALPYKSQRFRMPFEFEWRDNSISPRGDNAVYLLHPCMHQIVQDTNNSFRYFNVRIGHGLEWTEEAETKLMARRFGIFVSYASADWERRVSGLLAALENHFNESGESVDVWIDRNKMEGAKKYLSQMSEGNERSDYMVFFASASSVVSPSVLEEVAYRKELDRRANKETLFTVIIDETRFDELPYGISADHVIVVKDSIGSMVNLGTQMAERYHRDA